MRKSIIYIIGLAILLLSQHASYAYKILTAARISALPVIDGKPDEFWNKIEGIRTFDKIAEIEIELKAAYNAERVFFLVSFPDIEESRSHKSWIWNKTNQIYESGPDREDVFIFIWNMLDEKADLSLYADNPWKTDIWFWKAYRTDPLGFADDKMNILSQNVIKAKESIGEESIALTSKTGHRMYLLRKPDSGEPAFNTQLCTEYMGEVIPRFLHQAPSASRADVRAKGAWQQGKWVIEFSRALDTGNSDDIRFDLNKEYQFAVSRFEEGGRPANPKISQPLYGCGDAGEELILAFEKK